MEITIQLIEENAYNGQFSKEYQKISEDIRLHVPCDYGANHSSSKVRPCAHELFCAFSECVPDVASTSPKQAFSGIQLAGNVDASLRPQR